VAAQLINYFGTGDDGGDYSFLSNFYRHRGRFTVEHYYQAAKTDDPIWAANILKCATPGEAKKLGRLAPIVPGWDDQKIGVMRTLLRVKFSDWDLGDMLLATGDATLVEGNWWGDTFWGVCKGTGENWLGRLLMETRDLLRCS